MASGPSTGEPSAGRSTVHRIRATVSPGSLPRYPMRTPACVMVYQQEPGAVTACPSPEPAPSLITDPASARHGMTGVVPVGRTRFGSTSVARVQRRSSCCFSAARLAGISLAASGIIGCIALRVAQLQFLTGRSRQASNCNCAGLTFAAERPGCTTVTSSRARTARARCWRLRRAMSSPSSNPLWLWFVRRSRSRRTRWSSRRGAFFQMFDLCACRSPPWVPYRQVLSARVNSSIETPSAE
jgi:hypothetical protein